MAHRRITEARKQEFAQRMRDNPTEAEAALGRAFWRAGLRPRRQVIVSGFIVDFLFVRAKVVVEVDGYYHFTRKGRTSDKIRTGVLTRQGFTVLRFSNAKVARDPEQCITDVRLALARSAKTSYVRNATHRGD